MQVDNEVASPPEVDAVFTWVDGSDPAHRLKREEALQSAFGRNGLPAGFNVGRWDESGELAYAVRSVRRFAPWAGAMYIVTDAQRPHWLDDETAAALDVTIVDHQVIFEGRQEWLPTFSPRSIETMLAKIPGLSRHFLYFNDDMCLTRPSSRSDFFRDGRPVLRGTFVTVARLRRRLEAVVHRLSGTQAVRVEGLVGMGSESELLRGSRFFRNAHAPYVLDRAWFDDIYADEALLARLASSTLRDPDQPWVLAILANQALRAGQAVAGPKDWEYLHPDFGEAAISQILNRVGAGDALSLCVQALHEYAPEVRNKIQRSLSMVVDGSSDL